MKKSLTLLLGYLFLTACVGHETNLQIRQEERDQALYQKRAQEGCTFVKDQAAYRECLLNTYYSKHPSTYETAEMIDGKSIAIVKSNTSFEDSVVKQVAPLPATQPEIYSYKQSETTTMDAGYIKHPTKDIIVTQEEVYTQKQNLPPPTPIAVPQPLPVVQVSNNQVKPVAVVSEPTVKQEQTWWKTYQEQRPVAPQKPVCPCPDPNDPCPQCYEK